MESILALLASLALTVDYQPEPFSVSSHIDAQPLVLSAGILEPFGVRYESNLWYYLAVIDDDSGVQMAEQ